MSQMTGNGAGHTSKTEFCLVRVDDRLLHGQVVLNWMRALRPRRVAIVDTYLAGEPALRAIMEAACPLGVSLWVGTVAQATALRSPEPYPPSETMILVRTPTDARTLYDLNVHYSALNVGCLGMAPGRRRVCRQVYLSAQELEELAYLAEQGVDVSVQALPVDRALGLAEMRRCFMRARSCPG